MSPKIWFITGSSSGLGRAMTEYVLEKGDIAIATLRNPSAIADLSAKYPESQLLTLKLDVTQPQDITAAFAAVKSKFGHLDVCFNNAGYALFSDTEGAPDEAARKLFETNFWGALHVSTEAIKFFREVNKPGIGGRLLNVSSMVGLAGSAAIGLYSASKFALEGMTESLDKELLPGWNIKITIIEPGTFETRQTKTEHLVMTEPNPAYAGGPSSQIRAYAQSGAMKGGDAHKAVRAIYAISEDKNAPLRIPLGKDSIQWAKGKIESLTQDINNAEQWSEDLAFDT